MTLCHYCGLVIAHAEHEALRAACDHALDEHRAVFLAEPHTLIFSDLSQRPEDLLTDA